MLTAVSLPTSLALPLSEALSKHKPAKPTIRETVFTGIFVLQVQLHSLTFGRWVPVVLQPADDAVEQAWPGDLHGGEVRGPKCGRQIGYRHIPNQRPLLKKQPTVNKQRTCVTRLFLTFTTEKHPQTRQ